MKTSNDSHILLDTNILIYAMDSNCEFHETCKNLRDKGLTGDISLCVTPQVLNEFFAIITNHRRVQEPISMAQAAAEVEKYIKARNIKKIYQKRGVIKTTLSLLQQHPTKAYGIFDIQLVATMKVNNVSRICTYNKNDFIKFDGIEVGSPENFIERK